MEMALKRYLRWSLMKCTAAVPCDFQIAAGLQPLDKVLCIDTCVPVATFPDKVRKPELRVHVAVPIPRIKPIQSISRGVQDGWCDGGKDLGTWWHKKVKLSSRAG